MIKVATYCRVSTDKDDQANSFDSPACWATMTLLLAACSMQSPKPNMDDAEANTESASKPILVLYSKEY